MVSMDFENRNVVAMKVALSSAGDGVGSFLQKFRLYETHSNFYMIGRDKNRTFWKVLKISRSEHPEQSEQSELSIIEDSTIYSEIECYDLLKRIHEGNLSTGGLKFVTTCYGIVGIIKFLGPYYMLLITKRRKIGTICGHAIYSIAKSEMIQISNSTVHSNMTYSKNENRYKKLLRAVDLTKDFYFSYSYHVMHSLQKNLSNHEAGLVLYETMFVWNEFLTRGIRKQVKNSLWTVALVYGFFKQVKVSVAGRDVNIILIARRSRHYAGTRYLKRGVNEKGRVANDVETEQIVLEDVLEGSPIQISSAVQNRGSIPLFWSQETSRLNIKPDIILSKKDDKYEATRLHFDNLVKRYGNPIIILNLIKTREKKPREAILRSEFANAIEVINKDLPPEMHLKFLHWDLSRHSRNKATSVLECLVKVASNALDLTGFFYCHVLPSSSRLPCHQNCNSDDELFNAANDVNSKDSVSDCDVSGIQFVQPPVFQKGVLRTNCIDCLDRTNVAQFVYGLVALGHQLHVLRYLDVPYISLDSPLADELMKIYEAMGDTLALQYGGSAAHNKIFSERRGQWKATTQSQEFFRTLQRYYSNAYMDPEKQDAINVFLGHFQPQLGKPALWELDSDQHCNVGTGVSTKEHSRSIIKRSLSDGSILCESISTIEGAGVLPMDNSRRPLPVKIQDNNINPLESTPEIPPCESNASYYMHTPSTSGKKLFPDATPPEQNPETDSVYSVERGDSFDCSNFFDLDWLSSGNSCEEETYERSLNGSPSTGMSSGELRMECSSSSYRSGSSLTLARERQGSSSSNVSGYSDQFAHWVAYGDVLMP
ncbi:phosphoinositide phosphatase SAC2-like isoform X2 [Andrographis paniculata]|uniref:phosphoinositide phosphatase SAC2-like isoform X2 n=1 Tax=Andrographis paniculata TaxID=175694 RepID=UPI0021E8E73E|nr:phosphoinositide phosphatase SAC2-like isoform X2 [Andrographis paniculata]